MTERSRKPDDLIRVNISQDQAATFRDRYRPIVELGMRLAGYEPYSLDALLLSVYLQGVIDGAHPDVQARLAGVAL